MFMPGAVREDSPLEILAFRVNLSLIVEGPKLGHQISGVLCGVHSQRLGDDEERPSELCNSQLLSGTLKKQKRRATFQHSGNFSNQHIKKKHPTPDTQQINAIKDIVRRIWLTMLVA